MGVMIEMDGIAKKTIRLHGIAEESIVDGPGYRLAIFAQGCPRHCEGCHNPKSHDPTGGTEWELDELERLFTKSSLLEGITLTGGEPFLQAAACAELARRAHGTGLTVWAFSGYTYEELQNMAKGDREAEALMAETDVLVDGPFILSQRSLELSFCGSRNQRVIDMRKTRENDAVTLYMSSEW